ncbi:MAG: alpha/beta hydrolase [Actinomycetota bacterium]
MGDDPGRTEISPTELAIATGRTANGGEQIYWELASTGPDDDRPVVVLSHGAGGSHAVWYLQVPALGRRFRVLTWDSRGFGNSSNDTDSPSPDAAAADLAAILDDLGIDGGHLVGQSMGGWHIAAFADAFPERVRSLVFADTVGGLWTDGLREAMQAFQATGGLAGDGRNTLGGHPALWAGTAMRDPAHAFLYQALGSFHQPPMDKLGATVAWTVSHDRIAGLGVPVLFLAGSHDQIFPAPLLAESAARIPGAGWVEIPAAGHSPYFEQPEVWNDAVLTFLADAAGHGT